MQAPKATGRQATVVKYDILSALGVYALGKDKHVQKRVLRFSTLVTTRYNWKLNELSIGRAEMARLWSVNERTVKRELAKLREIGWMSVKRPAVRGRVAVYRLHLERILEETRGHWDRVGCELAERLEDHVRAPERENVVPFARSSGRGPVVTGTGVWGQVQALLSETDPGTYATWFQHLHETGRAGVRVDLVAPSRFAADYIATHLADRLIVGYASVDPTIRDVRVTTGDGVA